MRLLLDTNIYVYMVSDMDSLTLDVRAVLEDVENLKYQPARVDNCIQD